MTRPPDPPTPPGATAPHELRFARPLPPGLAPRLPADTALEPTPAGGVDEAGVGGGVLRWRGALLMGVVNVTPDSFSDGGRFHDHGAARVQALRLIDAGAVVVDVGGESTRPGAEPVTAAEELRRVLPLVQALVADGRALVSLDTSKPEVAAAALDAGAHLVNDVTALREPEMRALCAERGAPAVLMHMQGEPRTMQRAPRYRDVVAEVEAFLLERAAAAREAGVPAVAIDPGIGFGKTVAHNLALLRATARLASHHLPLLVGASRKRFLGRLADEPRAERRDPGSLAAHLYAAERGAALLRVHEVAAHAQALAVWRALHDEDAPEGVAGEDAIAGGRGTGDAGGGVEGGR